MDVAVKRWRSLMVYEGIPFIWGFRDSWGMLQGYVGVFLDYRAGIMLAIFFCMPHFAWILWMSGACLSGPHSTPTIS